VAFDPTNFPNDIYFCGFWNFEILIVGIIGLAKNTGGNLTLLLYQSLPLTQQPITKHKNICKRFIAYRESE